MVNLYEKQKLEVRRHGDGLGKIIEERNRGIDICSATTSPKNELDK